MADALGTHSDTSLLGGDGAKPWLCPGCWWRQEEPNASSSVTVYSWVGLWPQLGLGRLLCPALCQGSHTNPDEL